MVENKQCDMCHNVATVTVEDRTLCSIHYFQDLEVATPFSSDSKENHWSVLLRELRTESGLTQRNLARETKMSQRTIADYENIYAPRELSIYKVERLLNKLGYELDAIRVDPEPLRFFGKKDV